MNKFKVGDIVHCYDHMCGSGWIFDSLNKGTITNIEGPLVSLKYDWRPEIITTVHYKCCRKVVKKRKTVPDNRVCTREHVSEY